MQPSQCDLQPQIQETHRPSHTGTSTCCRTQRRNQTDRSRNRCTHEVPFIAGRSHFTRKNTRFRAPANKTHATCMQSMRFAASRSKPAGIYAHGNTTWQQSYAAITQASYRLVMWCQVSHHSLTPPFIECIVMWCKVTSPFIECIATWCKVSHHPSLSVLLRDAKSQTTVSHHPSLSVLFCDVKSHATLHWVYCCVMQSLTPPFIECIVLWCKVTPPFIECIVVWCKVSHHPSLNVLLCDVKSHHPSLSVLLCDVKPSHHPSWGKAIRNSEDCFPTSCDKYTVALTIYNIIYIYTAKKCEGGWDGLLDIR